MLAKQRAWVLVVLIGCGPQDPLAPGASSTKSAAMLDGVRVTYYTVVSERTTSGQHTGDSSTVCNAQGLSGCYHKEFLCSGWGVAMQGSGIGNDGRLVRYVSGGGGWASGYRQLNNCASARFAYGNSVTGTSGRALVENYSIAVDRQVIPLGWYVWIDSEGHWFRADDTGGSIHGRHVDIFRGSNSTTVASDHSRVFTTATRHEYGDPSPYGGGNNENYTGGGGGNNNGNVPVYPNSCASHHNQRCEEPPASELCLPGTDTYDCTYYPPTQGGTTLTINECRWAFDHVCDEPEGTGACDEGSDAWDCQYFGPGATSTVAPIDPNSCQYAYDRECDEPAGTNYCAAGTDTFDCGYAGGSTTQSPLNINSCYWAFDHECDEPEGTANCPEGTDTWDCTFYPPGSTGPVSVEPNVGTCVYYNQQIDFFGTCSYDDDSWWVVFCNDDHQLELVRCDGQCGWRSNSIGYDCLN